MNNTGILGKRTASNPNTIRTCYLPICTSDALPSVPDKSRTYDLPISTSDALSPSYRRLAVDQAVYLYLW